MIAAVRDEMRFKPLVIRCIGHVFQLIIKPLFERLFGSLHGKLHEVLNHMSHGGQV